MEMSNHTSQEFVAAVHVALADLEQIPESSGLPVADRLTAFFFLLLDQIEGLESADQAALRASFSKEAAWFTSDFHEAVRTGLSAVMNSSDVPLVNRVLADSAPARFMVAEMLVQLLSASLGDDSEGKQRSAAPSDKVLAAAASVLASQIPQKTADVFRYAVEADYLPISNIPFVSDWLGMDSKSKEA